MITTNDLRRGTVIEAEGVLYQVVEFQHSSRARVPRS